MINRLSAILNSVLTETLNSLIRKDSKGIGYDFTVIPIDIIVVI